MLVHESTHDIQDVYAPSADRIDFYDLRLLGRTRHFPQKPTWSLAWVIILPNSNNRADGLAYSLKLDSILTTHPLTILYNPFHLIFKSFT